MSATMERVRELEGLLEDAEQALHEAHEKASVREGKISDLLRRNHGMLRRLTRIRQKADLATGITAASVDDADARALAGRAAGAEGAVDLLIAKYAGGAKGSDKPGAPCSAEIHHGPGHQSTTRCRLRGEHEIHEARFGSFDQLARWRGQEVSSGHSDEAPDVDE